MLSLSPGPHSRQRGGEHAAPPRPGPRWRPGGAGGNGAGRGGAEESGGTDTGPGGQGTAMGRYPAGSGDPRLRGGFGTFGRLRTRAARHLPYPRAAPVLLAGSGAPGGSGTIGRLRCPVAAAHPGGSGVPSPGRGEGGSGRSQASGRGRPGRSSAQLPGSRDPRPPSEGSGAPRRDSLEGESGEGKGVYTIPVPRAGWIRDLHRTKDHGGCVWKSTGGRGAFFVCKPGWGRRCVV